MVLEYQLGGEDAPQGGEKVLLPEEHVEFVEELNVKYGKNQAKEWWLKYEQTFVIISNFNSTV